jgi:hypothetical protein
MALTIQDPEIEQLAAEVAELAGEDETQAIRGALRSRRAELRMIKCRDTPVQEGEETAGERVMRVLREQIWPQIPEHLRGQKSLTKEEFDAIIGYNSEGHFD